MATLKGSYILPLRSFPFHPFSSPTPSRHSFRLKKPISTWDARAFSLEIPKKVRVLRPRGRPSVGGGGQAVLRSGSEEEQRPPFDINLAIVLAGFAFEAYTSPPVILQSFFLLFFVFFFRICFFFFFFSLETCLMFFFFF